MIDFSQKTFENILREQLQLIAKQYDKREGSLIDTALRPEAWTLEQIYIALAQIQKNGFMVTATDPAAIDNRAIERGVIRDPATVATVETVFDIAVGLNKRFSTINGADSVIFRTTKLLLVDANGLYHYQAVAETPGIIGNNYSGSILPLSSEWGSSLKVARIEGVLIPGNEAEDDETVKRKYWESFNQQAYSGNIATYRQACLDIDGVGGVQVYPHWQGGGTVLCSIIDSTFSIPSSVLIELVQNTICPPEAGDEYAVRERLRYGAGWRKGNDFAADSVVDRR